MELPVSPLLIQPRMHCKLIISCFCRSVLSELKYFDVVAGSMVPDVMHDVLEGVLQYEAKLMLKQFINHDHYLTLPQLNQQIEAFELGYSEAKSRPSLISQATLQDGEYHLNQSGKFGVYT